ncbi:MAG: glycosyltransferase family 39 protein [Acidobacteriota bacterium]|nr:glycosyltransferase family 39 protein [Acidobacteriota bacterium]
MNSILIILGLLFSAFIIIAVPSLVSQYTPVYGNVDTVECLKAVLFCTALSGVAGWLIYRSGEDGAFLLKLFLFAVLLRVLIGTLIFIFNGQTFFGGDAITYDFYGSRQLEAWYGSRYSQSLVNIFVGKGEGSGWGMVYLVAVLYGAIGHNMLAVQFFNSVIGAATAPIIFLCAQQVYGNRRVSRLAAFAVAFYPSLVLWSSQGLKDAPIVFLLAFSILATLKLGQKLNLKYLVALALALFCLLSLRFYVFYMILAAIGGAFLIGMREISAQSFMRQFVVVIALGLALTYMGVTRYANVQMEAFGGLDAVQRSRTDAAKSAKSGFDKDVDVSTTSGALTTIPLGLLYLLFAPFPWQLVSLRQSITLPEMILWWGSFPMLVLGLWFSIRYRLRQISPILVFSVMLSLAYSVFQGNVGTAYRQRAQLLVFYFVFVAVGYVLMLEKREERKRVQALAQKEITATNVAASARRAPTTTGSS